MKRSFINQTVELAKQIFQQHGFYLPKFAHYSLQDWQQLNLADNQEIIDARLGWDITDFNLGCFEQYGLTLFTLRNRTLSDSKSTNKPYAEKIMLVQEGQITPMHDHWYKMEDIINRGGGNLILSLYQRDEITDLIDKTKDIMVAIDGEKRMIKAGGLVKLAPGQSICLPPHLYHSFWAEEGYVVAGEVSMANDDMTDNRFLQNLGRFSDIEEDESAKYLLCSDYTHYFKQGVKQ